mgnify:CR=1 FL=1
MTLALDAKDFPGAKGFHRELVKMEPTSLFVKAELGRELDARRRRTDHEHASIGPLGGRHPFGMP